MNAVTDAVAFAALGSLLTVLVTIWVQRKPVVQLIHADTCPCAACVIAFNARRLAIRRLIAPTPSATAETQPGCQTVEIRPHRYLSREQLCEMSSDDVWNWFVDKNVGQAA